MRNLVQFLFTTLFLLCALHLYSQERIYADAQSDAASVAKGDIFSVTYSLYNANYTQFHAPKIDGLELIGSPSKSTRTSIINGKKKSTASITYSYMGNNTGTVTIPPAEFESNQGRFATDPLTITIIKGSNKKVDEDIFLKIELNTDSVIVGEQVILDLKLYSTEKTGSRRMLKGLNLEHFASHGIRPNLQTNRENSNGKTYYVNSLRRIALFPQKAGAFPLGPVRISCNVEIPGKKRRTLFGYVNASKQKNLDSDSDTLYVVESDPKGLLKGTFYLKGECAETVSNTDEGIQYEVLLRSNVDPNLLGRPEIVSHKGKRISIFEPELVEETTRETEDKLLTTKRWKYLLMPEDTGEYYIRARVEHLDMEGELRTTESGSCRVDVSRGKYYGKDSLDFAVTEIPESAEERQTPWGVIALISGLSIILLGFLYRRFKLGKKKGGSVMSRAQEQQEQKEQKDPLGEALAQVQANSDRSEKSKILLLAVKKAGAHAGGLDAKKTYKNREIEDALGEKCGARLAGRWLALCEKLEAQRYAGAAISEDLVKDIAQFHKELLKSSN